MSRQGQTFNSPRPWPCSQATLNNSSQSVVYRGEASFRAQAPGPLPAGGAEGHGVASVVLIDAVERARPPSAEAAVPSLMRSAAAERQCRNLRPTINLAATIWVSLYKAHMRQPLPIEAGLPNRAVTARFVARYAPIAMPEVLRRRSRGRRMLDV